ncbi:sugar transferase [Bifidobacterium platyrrhinorum]|uniref:Exopolysaccharide biosynthesis polyprenyl glycosylphosphotransferase n=1 Tax=Bifidobacterium platyrrhinorum TaxID=2661628 RepID=A0A6L9SST0_9BIFI|nr:sugar transferase [Bifidobacterium platyrrhinorum]NEG55129.1 exopolysaccharide biosynthesis polyprenyl glycosylphosphotransferase [Bifidobacterium platyrrhinorum]
MESTTNPGVSGRSDAPRPEGRRDIRQSQLSRVLYWRFYINLALMLIDAAVFIIAGTTVLMARDQDYRYFVSYRFDLNIDLSVYLIIAALMYVYSLHAAGVYHRHVMGDGYQLNLRLFVGMVEAWVILCAFNFVLNLNLWLSTLTLMVAAAWLLNMIARFFVRLFITRNRKKGKYAYGTAIVGSPEAIGHMLRFLAQKQQLNYRPLAVCPIRLNDDGLVEPDPNLDELREQMRRNWGELLPVVPYSENDLAEHLADSGIQTVMVTDVLRRFSDNFNTFSMHMEAIGLEIALVTSAADVSGHETQVRSIQGTTVITIRLAQFSPARKMMKRLFDIIVSTIAIVLSSPFMLGVAIAIKLDDHGPVLYKQERIGLYGKPFKIYKFRSMRVDADKMDAEVAAAAGQELGARFKLKNDPRVTKVGHFIRKTSLDELPQFFNSFLGSMSVVGPRPQRQYEVDEYDQVYATRLLVKPGITGPWQVSGRNDLSEEESQQLDVAYVQNWSVLGDISYIFRTVGVMINPKGAY